MTSTLCKYQHSVKLFFLILVYTSCTPQVQEKHADWSQKLLEAYQALDKARDLPAAHLLFAASEKMPRKNWENYFVTAGIYATHQTYDSAFLSLEKALSCGLRDVALVSDYPEFQNLKSDPRFDQILKQTTAAKARYLANIDNPALLKILEEMWAADQQALAQYEANAAKLDSNATSADYQQLFTRVEKRWDMNKTKLDSIIAIHGWPGNRLVGEDGAKLAWAIPQHHPDVFFKQKCLVLIKEAVDNGDMDPNHYAELNDRIARETWQKQTYGASMGETSPYPIADPAHVNARRYDLGLMEPVEVYAYYHGIQYTVPSEAEALIHHQQLRAEALELYSKFETLAKTQKAEPANEVILKAIDYHGDLDNEELYNAALKLAVLDHARSEKIAIRILKTLIWRNWEGSERISAEQRFNTLKKHDAWQDIQKHL